MMSNLTTQANSEEDRLIAMWLHDRPDNTQAAYGRTVREFRRFVGKPLPEMTLEDLQHYATSLDTLKNSSKRAKLNAVKSLFTFATRLQYVRFNVAAALRLPKASSNLAGRILTKSQVQRLLQADNPRDMALLLLLYATGLRISEACNLTWADFSEQANGTMQVSVLGKGGKRRVVIVPGRVWQALSQIGNGEPAALVFGLDRYAAHRIVKAAAVRAGLPSVSAHWFRHAHASHSLSGGAPIHLVRDSLGHSSIAVTNVYLESMPNDSSSKYLDL